MQHYYPVEFQGIHAAEEVQTVLAYLPQSETAAVGCAQRVESEEGVQADQNKDADADDTVAQSLRETHLGENSKEGALRRVSEADEKWMLGLSVQKIE